ncbi:MAG TPA: Eco57I restriction-modification methylase domain-containing protein [Kofleriaceae bacterium]|nr:Eco57I restriction-modification methylase domain-containing protein [Kofleriaceae bacterium]
MAIDLANGSEYPSTISLDERRRSGTVYTPEPLVRFILDQAGCTIDDLDAPVLDPACGAAVFLCEVLERAAVRISHGALPLAGAERRSLIRFATRSLFGVDIDPNARLLALQALRSRFQQLAPGPLAPDFLSANIVEDDFLTGSAIRTMRPMRRGGFAFVVGNPPYVSTVRLPNAYKTRLRTLFATAVGRVDLYTLFFERALQLLRPDGVLSFITPDKFLASETSRDLRAHLAKHGSLRRVAMFRSHKVFPDAAVVPCVTVIGRSVAAGDVTAGGVHVLACESERGDEVRITAESRACRDTLGGAPWQFRPTALMELVERLRVSQPGLDTLARRISAGPATGRDDIYVRPFPELEHVEPELLRPAIRGRDITPFSIADAGLRILLPYMFVDDRPQLIALARFPRARRYLEQHRASLAQRHCVRVWEKAWFDLHDLPATDITGATKIVVPDVAEHCRFAVDHGRFFPLHSAYYIVLEDESSCDFVAAVLNSPVIEFILRLLSPVAKDGFSRFRRQFLATLPIASADAGERRRIVRLTRDGEHREANDRIATLYGVGPDELRMMSSHLASLRGVRS